MKRPLSNQGALRGCRVSSLQLVQKWICTLICAPDAPWLAAGHGNGQCYQTNVLGKVLHANFKSEPLNPEIAKTKNDLQGA